MNLETVLFYFLGAISIGSALMMVTRRSPVIAALYLILNFFALGGLYLTLHAQFIAFIQILVYAGAIMVLFLFVIMLLNLGDEKKMTEKISYKK
ncbi:MAG TPA: NADH-quinone oxidoreductase subunit J, partial [Bacteroidetes bacterium]|nr:NADH-quinone oxidoreductase subunit J [Bacteroidota bacterium]